MSDLQTFANLQAGGMMVFFGQRLVASDLSNDITCLVLFVNFYTIDAQCTRPQGLLIC